MQYISQLGRLVSQYWFWGALFVGLILICILIDAQIRQKKAQQLPGSRSYATCPNCGQQQHAGRKCGTP